jgi:hypothetical protein
VDVKSLRK